MFDDSVFYSMDWAVVYGIFYFYFLFSIFCMQYSVCCTLHFLDAKTAMLYCYQNTDSCFGRIRIKKNRIPIKKYIDKANWANRFAYGLKIR